MAYTKQRFASFEDYLTAEPSDLPEGRCEYWDGELVEVTETIVSPTFPELKLTVAIVLAG